jgi:hypothetical protein
MSWRFEGFFTSGPSAKMGFGGWICMLRGVQFDADREIRTYSVANCVYDREERDRFSVTRPSGRFDDWRAG